MRGAAMLLFLLNKKINESKPLMKSKMKLIERMKAPTPKFFRVLRNIGLALAAAGGAVLAAPITLPAGVIAVAGYLTVAGGVITAVSQSTVDGETDNKTDNGSS
jgi:hypothetical protein